jgi:glycosyltransferase involved in cell wall biosynthesis
VKIVHVARNNGRDGASRAAYRLHSGLIGEGIDSSMLVLYRDVDDPKVRMFSPAQDLPSSLRRRIRYEIISKEFARYSHSRPTNSSFFKDDRSIYGHEVMRQMPPADLINLHAISEFIDYESFLYKASRSAPLVWLLHDMQPFTGGCQYDMGCDRFLNGCGQCPQLGSSDGTDLSQRIWKRKEKTYNRIHPNRMHIVTPCRWLEGEVRRSKLLADFPITVIPLGLDTNLFAPRDRSFARSLLEIAQDAVVVLFIATYNDYWVKGYDLLVAAINEIAEIPNLLLVSVGQRPSMISGTVKQLNLGMVADDKFLSLIYSSADVLVAPSRYENFGQTMLESIACGTPVVGFDVGGNSEIIRPELTGLLAPKDDVGALSQAIRRVLGDNQARADMQQNCRRIALEEYSLPVLATNYIALYEGILGATCRSTKTS